MQTCVVHLIRAAMRFVSYKDRKASPTALKPIYTAADAEAARVELEAFKASELGRRYPHAVATLETAWDRFIPFLAFPPELRRVIYTTNTIESLNFQLRKIIKNRGQFPNDEAVVKLLWLAICNIEDKRARAREKERGRPANQRKAPGRLVEGQIITNWKQALAQLALAYPDRIKPHIQPTGPYTENLTGSIWSHATSCSMMRTTPMTTIAAPENLVTLRAAPGRVRSTLLAPVPTTV